MVTRSVLTVILALAWMCESKPSVLVPTYVLPPDTFIRDQRSIGSAPITDRNESQRTIKRLIGGHMKITHDKEHGTAKNSIAFDHEKSSSGKFVGVLVPDFSGSTVGWNQGIWDDGMLMSSAGEGKESGKTKENDEDTKTLSDQVNEGKYGLIQNEIFEKNPKRPGIISYEPNSETRSKDNLQTLGGLKKDEIWLSEDHLLVLKGGSFSEDTKEPENRPWPPIDDYEAPRRQVKLPQKPKIPPPFPVRLSDDGPLVFLTPNGSIPAAFFPPFFAGEGEGPLPPPPFPYTSGAPYPTSDDQRNFTTGRAPMSIPPFPFLSGNASEGSNPFHPSMNGSFPEGFPPGAAFLPPPSNQSDLYDEDDPSIYYPPPYNFSYRGDNNNKVPAGPLVPGIILPPPPDFFAALEESTTEAAKTTIKSRPSSRPKSTLKRPSPTPAMQRNKYKTRPTTTESTHSTDVPNTISTPPSVELITTPKQRVPLQHSIQTPLRTPVRVQNLPDDITTRPKQDKHKIKTKVTSKPLSVSVIYDYPEQIYDNKIPTTSEKPYIIYSAPSKSPNLVVDDVVTSTPVPLRYYSNVQNDHVPTTKLQPVYNKPNENALASFYFYDEQPKTSPSPGTYFDGRNYYNTLSVSPAPVHQKQNAHTQSGFSPIVDVSYGSVDQADTLFLWPQNQGPRTLTQEYFSIQKPRSQPVYVPQPKRPDAFYQQIANIQQTIDLFTTTKPKAYTNRPNIHKPKTITSRPVYQFSYQSKPKPDQLSFRAPKLDPEPFRPMVSYSKPLNIENDFNAITPSMSPGYHQQYLIENVKVTTETPTSTRYYPKTKLREDDYDDTHLNKDVRPKKNRNHIQINNDKPVVHHANRHQSTTPNPINHGYYTKQDERYFDDITKNSFDVFGKKIEDNSNDLNGLGVTPPLGTVRTPVDNDINLQYAYEIVDSQTNRPSLDTDTIVNERFPRPPINPDSEPIPQRLHNGALVQTPKPPSLAEDTLVNKRPPLPQINPDSEFIPIQGPGYRTAQHNRLRNQVPKSQFAGEQYDLNRPSLIDDTLVNYRPPLPAINPDAEWIAPLNAAGEGRPGSYVSYRLPGDGAHVYFLTPQAAHAARDRYRTPGYGR